MPNIRIAAASLNQTPLDWPGNRDNILAAIEAARAEGASLVCLPEMCVSGYGCEDAFLGHGLHQTAMDSLREMLPATKGMIVSFGLPVFFRRALFNCACLAVDGQIAGFVGKRFLCGDGLHYEPRWFKPWPRRVRDLIEVGGRKYPIGDLVFDCGGVKIGFEICEDAWVPGRPAADMSARAVDVILNPSASHFAFGKAETHRDIVLDGSRAFNVTYIYANLLGNEAGRAIYDGGALIASSGKMLAEGPRLSFLPWHVTSAVVDIEAARAASAKLASFQPEMGEADQMEFACDFQWNDVEPESPRRQDAEWQSGTHRKEEEFARAVALGLFDYMRKSRSRGFVVSLSGGADSSAVSCLVAMMAEMAHAELGEEAFCQTLSHIPNLREAAGEKDRARRLLHCVYQATRNSSQATRAAAVSLAEALGAEVSCMEIDELVDGYIARAEAALGRKLAWETDDLALQNIQARVRGPSVWLIANVKNALLLATSNRSEAAVGYATMDGDTSGGLSPIAGIDKAFLLQWLRWLETVGPMGLRPIPALSAVTQAQPTAELRPPSANQTDEDDLMPYMVLDAIERLAIRDKKTPVEIFRLIRVQFRDYEPEQLRVWVARFFRLWCRNQWKRERYAPSFHLDDENLDPKTWCRFPILSGGFERELEELQRVKM